MKYTLTNESVTVVTEDGPVTVRRGQPNFHQLRRAIIEEDEEAAMEFLTIKDALKNWSNGKFSIKDDSLVFGSEEVPAEISSRVLEMLRKDENPDSFLRFWEHLDRNPSYRSVQQLFRFLANENIPIQPDGTFLAYKAVRNDLKDLHSGTFLNSPGTTHQMPRNKISDDPKLSCHIGFHVGSLQYAKDFGGNGSRLVVCEINPANVVCVPFDSSSGKVRVCCYKVKGFYSGQPLSSTTHKTSAPKKEKAPRKTKKKVAKNQKASNCKDWGPLTPAGIKKLDTMSIVELGEMHIVTLRRYASYCKIVGAYKLKGGKIALLNAIAKVRG